MFRLKKISRDKDTVFLKMESDPELVSLGTVKKEKARWLIIRGDHLANVGKTDDAINDFKEAIEIDPDIVDAYLYLAMCCVMKKYDWDTVVALLKEGLAVPYSKSEVPLPRINICFQLGQHYLIEKDGDNAKKYLDMGTKLIKDFNSDEKSIKELRQIKKKMHMKTDIEEQINALGTQIFAMSKIVEKGDFSGW